MTLSEAIEGLYGAFSPYRRRAAIDACSHCVGREEQDTLARVPLRALSCDQLSRYAFKAMTTWGGPQDYKHFLPRIIELSLTREGRASPGLDLQLIAGKMELAGGKSWPEAELRALASFCGTLWQTVLGRDPLEGPWRAHDALPSMAAITGALSPYLEAWSGQRSPSSSLQLADFIDAIWADIANRGHLCGAWTDLKDREVMERWLTDPARRGRLEEAFEQHVDGPLGDRFAAAIDAWQWMTSGAR